MQREHLKTKRKFTAIKNETSLAKVHPMKVKIPEKSLAGTIIDGRYKVGDTLGGGYTGFVRSGMRELYIFFEHVLFFVPCRCILIQCILFRHFQRSLGIDTKTGKPVAIKFATNELYHSLEKEYNNYLCLGADGTCLEKKFQTNILF